MLLETKRGKENKVTIPLGTEEAVGNHIWTRDAGYKAVAYVHQEYPKVLYKKKVLAEPVVLSLLNDLFGVEDDEDRQAIYLTAMQQIGEAGVDIRQWPLTAPSDVRLKAMQSVLRLHARDQMRDEWLANNPTKTASDYKRYIDSPDTIEVNTQDEETIKVMKQGWCFTPECKSVIPEVME